jgi:hypothetical protein
MIIIQMTMNQINRPINQTKQSYPKTERKGKEKKIHLGVGCMATNWSDTQNNGP